MHVWWTFSCMYSMLKEISLHGVKKFWPGCPFKAQLAPLVQQYVWATCTEPASTVKLLWDSFSTGGTTECKSTREHCESVQCFFNAYHMMCIHAKPRKPCDGWLLDGQLDNQASQEHTNNACLQAFATELSHGNNPATCVSVHWLKGINYACHAEHLETPN